MNFYLRRTNALKRTFVVVCFMVNGFIAMGQDAKNAERAVIGSDETAKLLETMALQMRSNYERIETWSGTCAFTDWMRPSVEWIIVGIHESRSLAALRSALLPKLVAGELQTKDNVEAAG